MYIYKRRGNKAVLIEGMTLSVKVKKGKAILVTGREGP
jgi:hypothetical protein